MTVDFSSDAFRRLIHRKGDRYSYLVGPAIPGPGSLENGTVEVYTKDSKSQSFRLSLRRHSALEPLLKNQSVTLLMDDPRATRPGKIRRAPDRPIPVVIVPGPLFGSSPGKFLVAVTGRGSTVVEPMRSREVTNLVLSGIPSRLAHALIDEFRRILNRT